MGIADMNFLPYCFLADTNSFFYIPHPNTKNRGTTGCAEFE